MNIPILIIGIIGCGCGLLACLYLCASLPAVLIWKLVQYVKGNRDIL